MEVIVARFMMCVGVGFAVRPTPKHTSLGSRRYAPPLPITYRYLSSHTAPSRSHLALLMVPNTQQVNPPMTVRSVRPTLVSTHLPRRDQVINDLPVTIIQDLASLLHAAPAPQFPVSLWHTQSRVLVKRKRRHRQCRLAHDRKSTMGAATRGAGILPAG